MKTIYIFLFICLITVSIYPQAAAVYNITVTDSVDGTYTLKFGIDPAAGEGLDLNLGESLLPPVPPPTVFESRFFLPAGDFSGDTASYTDFRFGTFPFTGTKEHRIRYQVGSGTKIYLVWDLPGNVTGVLQDVFTGSIINVNVSGKGYTTIEDPAGFDQLKFIVNYNGIISSTEEGENIPSKYSLYQNYPNPFNPETVIKFSLEKGSDASLIVYDMLGNEVKTLASGYFEGGVHTVKFSGNGLSSGIYFYKLKTNNSLLFKKMMLLK